MINIENYLDDLVESDSYLLGFYDGYNHRKYEEEMKVQEAIDNYKNSYEYRAANGLLRPDEDIPF